MMPTRASLALWAIALGLVLVVQQTAADSIWTPFGRLRDAERALDELNGQSLRALGRASRSEKGSRAVGSDRPGTAIGSDDFWALPDSSQLLFQSIPRFPDAEMRALSNWAGLLRTPSSGSKDTSSKETQSTSAADDFIEALLKTTRARLLDPSLRHSHRPTHNPKDHMDISSSSGVDDDLPDAGSSQEDGGNDSDSEQDSDAGGDSSSEGSTDTPSTEGAAETSLADGQQQHISTELLPAAHQEEEDPSSQRIADTDSAVEGQVLVTQAEIIHAMQSYGQVVLTSLKMRPMPAHELLRKTSVMRADAPAAVQAAAWQDNLKQALEAAVALETNTSTAQMHTRMTSIINLGLELAEPPVAFASAAASAVANSIKALTGDDSGVLVGVSLIRMGPQMLTHSTGTANSSGATGGHSKHAAARSSMLAMLTLYGVGAPSNAVQIAQRMQQACPDLYSTSLANSTCGRSIIGSVVAAVLAAERADKAARSSPAPGSPPAPSRTLLEQPVLSLSSSVSARGRSFTSSLKMTLGSSPAASGQPDSVSQPHRATRGSAGQQPAEAKLSPELEAFIHYSQSCLRVRQQPEVNIIITQAVGVTQAQQAGPLADKLQQLSASPALAELLALSGLTLAQAGKPQTIDLSAAALAAAGLDRGGTLAAASALGSEAAALGHSWGSGGSRDSSSSSSTANAKRDGGRVAAPAVIGIAVAVAVSVVAVCIAAVAIVVVKQRAKQARAAAVVDEQELPNSSKRRRSSKGKGVSSKYLPTSHPALAGSSGSGGIPPPPCVIVTAVSSPCQHSAPGQSPCKPCVVPGLRPAPLASAGSSALLSLGSGPATGASGAVSTPLGYAGMLGPAVTRGDSVSSAVMAEFAEQRQQLRAEAGEEEEEDAEAVQAGSDRTRREQQQQWRQQDQNATVRGTAALNAASPGSSGRGSATPLRTLRRAPQAAGAFAGAGPDSPQAAARSPFHRVQPQHEGSSSCSSPTWSRLAPSAAAWSPSKRQRPDPSTTTAVRTIGTPGHYWSADELATAASDGLRSVFSRPLSESSLPDDLRAHMAAAVAAGAAAAEGPFAAVGASPHNSALLCAAGCSSSSGSGHVGQQHSSHAPALPTLRTLHSAGSGHPEQPSSRGSYGNGTPVRASPFMSAYDVSVLLCAASTGSALQPAGAAGLPSSSLPGSSTNQIPQWASSLASSSLGAAGAPAGPTGSCGSDTTSALCAGTSAVQHHSGPLQGQQQGERHRQSRAASGSQGSVRVTPFMKPGNVPPGFE